MDTNNSPIELKLSRDEALVLFEWLARFDEAQDKPLTDTAEQKVLWNLEAKLEQLLVEIVKPEYKSLVAQAKKNLNN